MPVRIGLLISFIFLGMFITNNLVFSKGRNYIEMLWLKDEVPSIELKKDTVRISLPLKLKKSIEQNFPTYRIPGDRDYKLNWADFYNFYENQPPEARDFEVTPEMLKAIKAPFIALGDFNQDKVQDVALLLIDKKQDNFWKLVIFHGGKEGYRATLLQSSPGQDNHSAAGNKKDLGPVQNYGISRSDKCSNGQTCLTYYVFESSSFEYLWERGRYIRVDKAD